MIATTVGTLGTIGTAFCGYKAWTAEEDDRLDWMVATIVSIGLTLIGGIAGRILDEYMKKLPFDCGNGEIIHLRKHQTAINLTNHPALTGLHLEQLKAFPGLKELHLTDCEKLTREGLEALKECPRLTFLEVKGCSEIGKWNREAIYPTLIEKLATNYEKGLSRFDIYHLNSGKLNQPAIAIPRVPYSTVRTFAAVESNGEWFPFTREVTEWRSPTF